MSKSSVLGLHHVTAMCGHPQKNVDFYSGVLGLRLIKVTVNFDDPGAYHLYYGDASGSPGTAITFFPWPNAVRGIVGNGETGCVRYSVPADSLEYWQERLIKKEIHASPIDYRFDEQYIRLSDPDGMSLELVASKKEDQRSGESWHDVPQEFAIRGFHSVELFLPKLDGSEKVLVEGMGLESFAEEGDLKRYKCLSGESGQLVDLNVNKKRAFGKFGRGSVHHVAWRVEDDAHEIDVRRKLIELGQKPTEQVERNYFRSVYFRESGGVLYELATDGPGFDIDEPIETLGQSLKLPERYEQFRSTMRMTLPEFISLDGVKFPQ